MFTLNNFQLPDQNWYFYIPSLKIRGVREIAEIAEIAEIVEIRGIWEIG